jgi:hypothetical protein
MSKLNPYLRHNIATSNACIANTMTAENKPFEKSVMIGKGVVVLRDDNRHINR